MKNRAVTKTIYIATLAAFLLYTLLPFFAVYSIPAESKQLSSVFGEKVLICTTEGFKFVTWQELADKNNLPKQHPDVKCPLCYFASHGTHYTPHNVVLALAYDAYATTLRYRQYNEILHSHSNNLNYQPRAPPSLLIT